MPDIVSRIKLEAQGADQAAREIRKLKEAYQDVGQSAQGLSPSGGVGRADPFSRAVSPAGGATAGGTSTADVMAREERSRYERDNQRERQQQNQNYNAALRPNMITQGAGVAEAAGTGRGGAAVGGVLGAASPLFGPAGIALAGGAALAMTSQKWAENEWERMQSIFGSGMAQRLGRGYNEVEGVMAGYGRMGVPMGMVQQFFGAGANAGMSGNAPGALRATNTMMLASRELGLDPSTAATFLGTLTRGGVDLESQGGLSGYKSVGRMAGAWGQENLSMFMSTLTQSVERALSQGIEMTAERVQRRSYTLGAYREFGGMSVQGAAALGQLAEQRGAATAGLQKPEDVVAFQAMREAGMSVTDTMLAMEQDPNRVNKRVFEFLEEATGGDEDLLRLRLQEYLGGTMGQVEGFIRTQRGMAEDTPEAQEARRTRYQAVGGGSVKYKEETRVTAARQSQMLRDVEKTMLQITTGLQEIVRSLFEGPMNYNPHTMTWEGYTPRLGEADARTPSEFQTDVLTSRSVDLWRRRAGIRETDYWSSFSQMAENEPQNLTKADYENAYRALASEYLERAREEYEGKDTQEAEEARGVIDDLVIDWIRNQSGTITSDERIVELLEGIRQALEAEGIYVNTDEGLEENR